MLYQGVRGVWLWQGGQAGGRGSVGVLVPLELRDGEYVEEDEEHH